MNSVFHLNGFFITLLCLSRSKVVLIKFFSMNIALVSHAATYFRVVTQGPPPPPPHSLHPANLLYLEKPGVTTLITAAYKLRRLTEHRLIQDGSLPCSSEIVIGSSAAPHQLFNEEFLLQWSRVVKQPIQ